MMLPMGDYCDVVFHECVQVNNDILEQMHMELRSSRIAYYNTGTLSTNQIIDKLGWETLHKRRETHVQKLVQKYIDNKVSGYMSEYFKVRRNAIHE